MPPTSIYDSSSDPISTTSPFFNTKDGSKHTYGKALENILVERGESKVSIPAQDILFIESEHVYCWVYFINNQRILQRTSLNNLTDELAGGDFMRVHRGYLVNLKRVTFRTKSMLFVGKHRIPISRSLRIEVMERLGGV